MPGQEYEFNPCGEHENCLAYALCCGGKYEGDTEPRGDCFFDKNDKIVISKTIISQRNPFSISFHAIKFIF